MNDKTRNLLRIYGLCHSNNALGCLHPGKCGSKEAIIFAEKQRSKKDQE